VLAAELPGRSAAVCRELTKRFEEVVRGSLEELAERFPEPPRGEITLVLGPPGGTFREAVDEDAARAAVAALVEAGAARRTAAEVVSGLTGVARNALYRGSL
jgi:16S rRNA (cytidine1402-2'-O)-methyltransferase